MRNIIAEEIKDALNLFEIAKNVRSWHEYDYVEERMWVITTYGLDVWKQLVADGYLPDEDGCFVGR